MIFFPKSYPIYGDQNITFTPKNVFILFKFFMHKRYKFIIKFTVKRNIIKIKNILDFTKKII